MGKLHQMQTGKNITGTRDLCRWLSVPWFLLGFYHERLLNCIKCLFSIHWDCVAFVFHYVNRMCHVNWSLYFETSMPSRNQSHLVMRYRIPLYVTELDLVSFFKKGVLHQYSSRDTDVKFLFLQLWFWYQENTNLIEWIWRIPFYFFHFFFGGGRVWRFVLRKRQQ